VVVCFDELLDTAEGTPNDPVNFVVNGETQRGQPAA